jgi:tetratricopeptide (TPR) repeat protein
MQKDDQSFYREMSELIRQNRAHDAVPRLRAHLDTATNDAIATSLLGSALLRDGQVDDALAVLRAASQKEPASFAAFGDLGFACAQAGRQDEAIAAFERAVELKDDFYPGWSFLSRLRFQAGQTDRAVDAFRRADACDPHKAQFQEVQTAISAERFADAEQRCRALLQRQPGYPRAAYTLAHLASRVGAHDEAARILRQALEFYPADVNLRAALVVSLEEAGTYAAALEEARRITELDGAVVASWLVLGRVHGHCGNYEECLRCYDRASQLADPDDRDTHGNVQLLRGHILKILGRHDDGIAAYRQSIAAMPGNGAGWWGLADMKTHRFDDADVAAMQALVADTTIRQEQRTQAAFALGKAAEDRDDYQQAFAHYAEANALRSNAGFDPEAQWQGIRSIKAAYSAEVLAVQAEPPPKGPVPIFIVGLPRSGSTLLEQILASHSAVEGTMELATLPNVLRRITIEGGKRKLNYPASMAEFNPQALAEWGQAYLDDTAMYRTDKPCFIDKLPTNFDKIGLIHKLLPQAIVIDARRHPMDCGFSCFRQHFAGGHLWSYDLQHIGSYYNAYLELMDYWDEVLPGKVLCVQYEKVIEDTEAATRRLLAHCGLPFEDACLRFFENRRPVRTASSEQVRQPIYTSAVARWKRLATELEPLQQALGEATLQRFANLG